MFLEKYLVIREFTSKRIGYIDKFLLSINILCNIKTALVNTYNFMIRSNHIDVYK